MKKRGQNKKFFSLQFSHKNSRGQVWIETVIYTLIAFVMIGLVLAFAKPKIEQLQDHAIIEQSLSLMKDIDNTILTMGGPGNQRYFSINIQKGDLKIDGVNDRLVFEIASTDMYSEPGVSSIEGNIVVNTMKQGSSYAVNLTRDYSADYDITYNGANQVETISHAAKSYNLLITNKGGAKPNIDMQIS